MNSIITMGMFPDKVTSNNIVSGGGAIMTKIEEKEKPSIQIIKVVESNINLEQNFDNIISIKLLE